MIRCSGDSQVKRPRGRPKGSAPFAERDQAALSQFADHYLKSPGLKLAPFLKSLGYEDKGVRRAQNKWGADKDRYLDKARERMDVAGADQLLDMITFYTQASNVCRGAAKHPRPKIRVVFRDCTRQRSCIPEEASLMLEFDKDVSTEADLWTAFCRSAEAVNDTTGQNDSDFGDMARSDLPLSHKLYAASVKLLEASFNCAEHDHQTRQSDHGVRSKNEEDKTWTDN